MSLPMSPATAPASRAGAPDTSRTAAPPAPDPVPGASRRGFLVGTGAMALAATAGATTTDMLIGRSAPFGGGAVVADDGGIAPGTVVAYIRPGESEITIMSGDREVVVDDPALVRAIARRVGEN